MVSLALKSHFPPCPLRNKAIRLRELYCDVLCAWSRGIRCSWRYGERGEEVVCFFLNTKPSHLKSYGPNASQNAPVSADSDASPWRVRSIKGSRDAVTTTTDPTVTGHAKATNSKAWSRIARWWAGNIKFSLTVIKGKIAFASLLVAVIYCLLTLDGLRFKHFLYWLQSGAKIWMG